MKFPQSDAYVYEGKELRDRLDEKLNRRIWQRRNCQCFPIKDLDKGSSYNYG